MNFGVGSADWEAVEKDMYMYVHAWLVANSTVFFASFQAFVKLIRGRDLQ